MIPLRTSLVVKAKVLAGKTESFVVCLTMYIHKLAGYSNSCLYGL